MKNFLKIFFVSSFLFFILYNIFNTESSVFNINKAEVIKEPNIEYGIMTDSFNIHRGFIKENQALGEVFYLHHIDHNEINKIVQKSKGVFDFRKALPGKKYIVLCSQDSNEVAQYLIYEESVSSYIIFDIRDQINVYRGQKEITIINRVASGKITTSLWNALIDNGMSPALVMELEAIYAWSIDFFKIQNGDEFKVYFEEKYINEKKIGIGRILAAEFIHKGVSLYAFYFEEQDNYGDYFDENGNTLRKAFLSAPLKFSRISSKFSNRRKHPVTGKWKGHFGTDYAAPTGTPIMSTADGTIIRASYTKNNGNYVKVRHNKTYTTQYLHMSKIKKGIRKGVFVKQGSVIGYVGSTGLATGPHVCYRFWKNNKQVDPYRQNLPPGDPISSKNKKEYMVVKDSLMNIINSNF